MSYLIRCDVCGRAFAKEDNDCTLRIEAYFENSGYLAYTRHVCQRCSADLERFMSGLQKRKEVNTERINVFFSEDTVKQL